MCGKIANHAVVERRRESSEKGGNHLFLSQGRQDLGSHFYPSLGIVFESLRALLLHAIRGRIKIVLKLLEERKHQQDPSICGHESGPAPSTIWTQRL